MDTEMADTATDVIERFCFSSYMGVNEIVTLIDADTNELQTFVICEGLPLTYLRALTVFLGHMNSLSVMLGLPEGEDDGIARIWARIKLPDSRKKKIELTSTPEQLVNIAVVSFHRRLMDFVQSDAERVTQNAQELLLDAISTIETRQIESRENPIRVTGLSEILKPLLSPPWWYKAPVLQKVTALDLSSY